jgi:hypothetical protein
MGLSLPIFRCLFCLVVGGAPGPCFFLGGLWVSQEPLPDLVVCLGVGCLLSSFLLGDGRSPRPLPEGGSEGFPKTIAQPCFFLLLLFSCSFLLALWWEGPSAPARLRLRWGLGGFPKNHCSALLSCWLGVSLSSLSLVISQANLPGWWRCNVRRIPRGRSL